METLLRVQDSPVPTQTVFGFDGSIATAPMDCTLSRSNTDLYVVPPLTDFHTPPLAAPTKTVMRPSFSTASSAAIRPLMVAEPMLRAGNPDTVAASNLWLVSARTSGATHRTAKVTDRINFDREAELYRRTFIVRDPL